MVRTSVHPSSLSFRITSRDVSPFAMYETTLTTIELSCNVGVTRLGTQDPDRYIQVRRTIIYIEQTLKNSLGTLNR